MNGFVNLLLFLLAEALFKVIYLPFFNVLIILNN